MVYKKWKYCSRNYYDGHLSNRAILYFNMEQYIPYSLICNLFSRNLETYTFVQWSIGQPVVVLIKCRSKLRHQLIRTQWKSWSKTKASPLFLNGFLKYWDHNFAPLFLYGFPKYWNHNFCTSILKWALKVLTS